MKRSTIAISLPTHHRTQLRQLGCAADQTKQPKANRVRSARVLFQTWDKHRLASTGAKCSWACPKCVDMDNTFFPMGDNYNNTLRLSKSQIYLACSRCFSHFSHSTQKFLTRCRWLPGSLPDMWPSASFGADRSSFTVHRWEILHFFNGAIHFDPYPNQKVM